ncbi:MAG TPA: hypothetical protein VJ022_13545 [Anaerolineales bacterium]|nr:hypothetical protein [Anaerolineales bacterium]
MALEYALKYKASPTCADFIAARDKFKILAGPVGGGKTSACIMAILMNAMQQEPDNDGIRRTRHLVVRNTVPMLRTTTIKSFLDWIPDGVYGRWLSSDRTYMMRFEDVEAEVLFMSLEDANDIRKLLSLETTTAFFNEFREINPDIVEGLIGTKRVGRYPSKKQGPGATYPCIIADTNMPSMDTWHQQVMDGDIGDWELFKQPGGQSAEVENLEFLPSGYYNTEGLSDEYIRTMINCEYGTSKEGMPVFRSTFVPEFHISGVPLLTLHSPDYPLLIGLDAGLTPAAVIGQMTSSGRLNVIGECYTEKNDSIGMERFLVNRLIPMIRSKFGGVPALIVVDPASLQRSQASEETVFDVIQKFGLKVRAAASNKLDLRIGSAETLFGRQVGGKAGVLVDKGCTGLLSALRYNYKFAMRKDGDTEDKPLKDHPASDLGDAFCYLTSYVVGASGVRTAARREIKTTSSQGWT